MTTTLSVFSRSEIGALDEYQHLGSLEIALDRLLALEDTKAKKMVFDKALKCTVNYPAKLREHIGVFKERISGIMKSEVYDRGKMNEKALRKKLIDLTKEPRFTIQKACDNYDLFKVNSGKKIADKSELERIMEPANAQHKWLYYALFVIALLQSSLLSILFSPYKVTVSQFKTGMQGKFFEVRRARNDAEGEKQKVRAYYRMSEAFDDADWLRLYHYRNVFVLCYIVSPEKCDQMNLFLNVANILIDGRHAAQGGKPSMFTAVLGGVVFEEVTKMMFRGVPGYSSKEVPQDQLQAAYEAQQRAVYAQPNKAPAAHKKGKTAKPKKAVNRFADCTEDDFEEQCYALLRQNSVPCGPTQFHDPTAVSVGVVPARTSSRLAASPAPPPAHEVDKHVVHVPLRTDSDRSAPLEPFHGMFLRSYSAGSAAADHVVSHLCRNDSDDVNNFASTHSGKTKCAMKRTLATDMSDVGMLAMGQVSAKKAKTPPSKARIHWQNALVTVSARLKMKKATCGGGF
jgi:hypothetical protein